MVRLVLLNFLFLLLAATRTESHLRGAVDGSKGRRNLTGALQNNQEHMRATRQPVHPNTLDPVGGPALQAVQGEDGADQLICMRPTWDGFSIY